MCWFSKIANYFCNHIHGDNTVKYVAFQAIVCVIYIQHINRRCLLSWPLVLSVNYENGCIYHASLVQIERCILNMYINSFIFHSLYCIKSLENASWNVKRSSFEYCGYTLRVTDLIYTKLQLVCMCLQNYFLTTSPNFNKTEIEKP